MDRRDRTFGLGILGREGKRALDAEQMLAAVLKRAGRKGFADRSFFHPLQRLIASCNAESDLNALGRSAVKFEIRPSLRNLLEFERRMRAWLGNRANRTHRARRYDLSRFGLDPNRLRARFKPYTDAFDIELEWPPKAGAARAPGN
jgi:hypothetical protein